MLLRIDISDQVWPTVAGLLVEEFGPPEPGVTPTVWANQAAARIFSEAIAELMEPGKPRIRRPDPKRIRPSRVR